jgi:hypothetical protein
MLTCTHAPADASEDEIFEIGFHVHDHQWMAISSVICMTQTQDSSSLEQSKTVELKLIGLD